MPSNDWAATACDPIFASRIMMISLQVAQEVATEDTATADHADRLNYANYVMRGEENPKLLGSQVIASNSTIQGEIETNPELLGSNIPDNDLQFAMSSVWTARALAFVGKT